MPYIKLEDRESLKSRSPENAGELNYTLTLIIQDYLLRKGLKYQNINDILGALEGCKLEFYRRIALPYEDEKIKENSDVMLIENFKTKQY